MRRRNPIEPVKKQRQNGRLLPHLWLVPPSRYHHWTLGCCICKRAWAHAVVENERGFCWYHHPDRAERILAGKGDRMDTPFFRLAHRPSVRLAEKIVRLAGRNTPTRKPPRPRKKPRDRRYVR